MWPHRFVGVGAALVLAFLAWWPAAAAAAAAAEGVRVEANRSGSAVAVRAQASVKAPLALIWETLTDYEHLPEFIPGIRKSRLIGRRGPAAIVEQDGEAGFLFLKYPISVVVESAEYPPYRITVQVIRGNLRQLEGSYQIEHGSSPEEYILHWSGLIEPDTVFPAFITVPLMRANIEDQFTGMVKEIRRRQSIQLQRDAHASKK